MPVNPDDYDDIIARINRKYEGDIRKGNDFESASRISTGSIELDAAMGGGIPIGRWSRFYGGYSSTKTLTTLSTIREAQKLGMKCAYYNIEKQYEPDFTHDKIGVDIDDLLIVEGSTIEEVGEKMEALFGVVHVHVIDSCSAAVSEDELNADVRDWRPGISARAWGKIFRRLNERFDHHENTVIMVDQVRTNFKTGGEEAPGGRILDHQSSMTVHFKKGQWLARNAEGYLDEKATQAKGASGQMEPAGIEIRARVQKSRVCRPFRTATMRLDLDSLRFDRSFEIIKAAKHYGVVEQRGAYYYYTEPGQTERLSFQGEKKFRAYVDGNIDFENTVREKVFASYK
jgi:recombination protein RecA